MADEQGLSPVIVAAPAGYSADDFARDKKAVLVAPHLCAGSHLSAQQPDSRPKYTPTPAPAKSAGLKARRAWEKSEKLRKAEWLRLHPEPKKLTAKEQAVLDKHRNAQLKAEAKAAKAAAKARAKEAKAMHERLLRERKAEGDARAARLAAEAKARAATMRATAEAEAETERRRNETPAQRQYREAKERKEEARRKEVARRAEEAAKKKAFDDEAAAWRATQVSCALPCALLMRLGFHLVCCTCVPRALCVLCGGD